MLRACLHDLKDIPSGPLHLRAVRSVKVPEYLVILVIFFPEKKYELPLVQGLKILLKIFMLYFCYHISNVDKD